MESLDLLNLNASGIAKYTAEDPYKFYIDGLSLLLHNKSSELKKTLDIRPDLSVNKKIKALELLNLVILDQKDFTQYLKIISKFPQNLDEVAYELILLYKALYLNIKEFHNDEFLNLDILKLKENLPSIIIYYSEFILRNNLEQKFPEVFDLINKEENFLPLVDENLIAQRHRLLALYYRRTQNPKEAEKALLDYRSKYSRDTELANKFIPVSIDSILIKKENILKNWDSILNEINSVIGELMINAGVYEETCDYYKCNDCCIYDGPFVSYTEFQHLLEWLEKQDLDLNTFKDRAQKIQDKHQMLYQEPLKVINDDSAEAYTENKHAYKFRCPCLGDDNRCEVYEARPIMCRSFGIGTQSGTKIQSCAFYKAQLEENSSQHNEIEVFDTRQILSLARYSDREQTGKSQVGTLVAWFTEN